MGRLSDEFERITPTGKIIAFACGLIAFVVLLMVFPRRIGPPELLVIFGAPVMITLWALLVAYVNADARRRGMSPTLWTLLAIFVPNAIGIILYFVLREPLLAYCSACGMRVKPGFVYCPRCGVAMCPACPACGKAAEAGWVNCVYCGVRLAGTPASNA